mgnify:CR=1 FL=1
MNEISYCPRWAENGKPGAHRAPDLPFRHRHPHLYRLARPAKFLATQGSRWFRSLSELGNTSESLDGRGEEHGIAGDTKLFGTRLGDGTAGGWSQPPANKTVTQLPEELVLQRPATAMVENNRNQQNPTCRRIYGCILVPCCDVMSIPFTAAVSETKEATQISLSPSPPSTPSCPALNWH